MILYNLGEQYKAIYSQTTRGKEQLLFCGQPFIYEKSVRMPSGEMKKFWRCNQWYEPDSVVFYEIYTIIVQCNLYSERVFLCQLGGTKSADLVCSQSATLLPYSIDTIPTRMLYIAKREWPKSVATMTKTFRILIIC